MKITEHRELHLFSLLSKRSDFFPEDLVNELGTIKGVLEKLGCSIYSIITVTYGEKTNREGKKLVDGEVLIELEDGKIPEILPKEYIIKHELHLVNALCCEYEGTPHVLPHIYQNLAAYIGERKLQPITAVYTLSKQPYNQSKDTVHVQIYVGINPNVV
ncbi:MAG TPA: hypothetical protein PLW34_06185 [Termitinemataceae bacterium]|nr:hypothetical protein [Termitinemataceae bacterium]HOM23124.1 hypothetical protein [Termitinemataceae bacterium]HPQ00352.1 hypothetical protein [Termitinemataceae bacterium]